MEFYTTKDLAGMFQASTATIRKEIERGRLKCFYVGNEARFTQFHIDEYTSVRNFDKTTRELELEEEKEQLLEVIKAKDQLIEDIKCLLLKAM